jgi:hypothetical protein
MLSRYSNWIRAGRPGEAGVRVPLGSKHFHFFISSRPALGSTQPPIKMRTGGSFPGVKRPRSKKCGSIHPLPHTSSWCNA